MAPSSVDTHTYRKAIYHAITCLCLPRNLLATIFPYGVTHKRKNASTRRDGKVLLQVQMNSICLVVAAWSAVLRRILSLNLGLAGKSILL